MAEEQKDKKFTVPPALAWVVARLCEEYENGFTGRAEVIFREGANPDIEWHRREKAPPHRTKIGEL